ncbi:MAG TPA: NAD(P)/FAD-dependent oxidoreductase, partial [Alphaproteobacteria bacterium]|nr:NAD(P)/FAD-dependent oxidoreductase [Alphaproteobacteria bacterium]
ELTVRLRGGDEITCRAFIIAVGVVPNAGMAREAGLEVDRGIIVDEAMRTSNPDVYAAGDVVELMDRSYGVRRPIPILPLAYRGGLVAGRNMASERAGAPDGAGAKIFSAIPMNSVEVLGYPVISAGRILADEGQDELTWQSVKDRIYRKLVLEGDVIVGALFAGEIDRFGIVTGLIQDKVPARRFAREILRSGANLSSLPEEIRSVLLER